MLVVKKTSLKLKREKQELPETLEREITDQEIEGIIRDQAITDLELDVLELQQKVLNQNEEETL